MADNETDHATAGHRAHARKRNFRQPLAVSALLSGAGAVHRRGVDQIHRRVLPLAIACFTATESDVILGILALVDLALMGSLLIIVIFSGLRKLRLQDRSRRPSDWPEWMGTIDFSALN